MEKSKIVYRDGELTKVIFGSILTEDDTFIFVIAEDSTEFRINKRFVVSIKKIKGAVE